MRNFNRDNNRFGGGRDFKKRDFGGRGSSERSDRFEMYQTTCSKCGNDCQVPFRPTTGKPVYCKKCFDDIRGVSTNRNNEGRISHEEQYKKQFESLNWKLDKILKILTPTIPPIVAQKKPIENKTKKKKSVIALS